MKRSLVMCSAILLACSTGAMASLRYDYLQQTTERPRRVQLPARSFLGVELGEVSSETVQRLKLRQERGALIEALTSGSRAAEAGLQKNDVVVKWDGEPIESALELSRHIRETPAGRAVRLGVIREGREIEINVKMGERTALTHTVRVARPIANLRVRPDVQIARSRVTERGHLGVQIQSMTPQLAEYFGLSKRAGALVVFVFADSPAAKAGLKAGDVILSLAGETVDNPMDLRRALLSKSEGPVELRVLRDKQERTLTVQLEKGTRSWLLADDSSDAVEAIAPMVISVPKISLAPMAVSIPSVKITPMVINVPKISLAPMAVSIPSVKIAPMVIQTPQMKLAPLAIPEIHIAPMSVEIPNLRIAPVKVLPLRRRIIL
ncbi:MAG: PDZ domain-containing protein [Blastocatellia bacterium]